MSLETTLIKLFERTEGEKKTKFNTNYNGFIQFTRIEYIIHIHTTYYKQMKLKIRMTFKK